MKMKRTFATALTLFFTTGYQSMGATPDLRIHPKHRRVAQPARQPKDAKPKSPAVGGGGFGTGAAQGIREPAQPSQGLTDHSKPGTDGTGGDNAFRNKTKQ